MTRKLRVRYIAGRGYFRVIEWVTDNSQLRWIDILIGPFDHIEAAASATLA